MQKITTEDFENSLYYIGAGYDIEPLLRFTHITNSFIYATLYVSLDNITEWYDNQFQLHPDIEIIGKDVFRKFDEVNDYDLHPDSLVSGYI